jgi:hypothetical protein
VSLLNALVARVVDGLLSPFADRPPIVGLAVVALLSAIAMLVIVRVTTNQARLAATRRALQACWFEIRLFNDDVPAMWRALGEMTRHHVRYLRGLTVPVVLMSVPLGVLVGQLHFHYGYGGLEVGRQAVITVRMKAGDATRGGDDTSPGPVLSVPRGLRIETPPVWAPSLREAAWRIVPVEPGDYEAAVQVSGQGVTKRIRVSSGIVRRSPVRPDGGLVRQLLNPAESPLPEDSVVESIAVMYPRRDVSVFGHEVHWIVVFFGFTMVFAFVFRRSLRVVL